MLQSLLNNLEWILGVPSPKVVSLNYQDTSINKFIEQINYIEEQGYKFITTSEVVEYNSSLRKINHKSVCLTLSLADNNILNFTSVFLESRNIKVELDCKMANSVNINRKTSDACFTSVFRQWSRIYSLSRILA